MTCPHHAPPRTLDALRHLTVALALAAIPLSGQDTTAASVDSTSVTTPVTTGVPTASFEVALGDDAVFEPRHHAARAIFGGTVGSGLGLLAGVSVGLAAASCSNDAWFCGWGEAAVAGLVTSAVGSALGANLGASGDGWKPSFKSTFGAALVGTAAGLVGAYLVDRADSGGRTPILAFTLSQGVISGLVASGAR